MFKNLLILSTLFALSNASCPNDCSGHGSCNVYSACECYRNWQAADCSERVCHFGHAFVDTPTGDLNADGRVTNTRDTFRVILGSDKSFFQTNSDATTLGTETEVLLGRAKRQWDAVSGITEGAARSVFKLGASTELVAVENDVTVEFTTLPNISTATSEDDIYGYVEACDEKYSTKTINYAIAFDVVWDLTEANYLAYAATKELHTFTGACGEVDTSASAAETHKASLACTTTTGAATYSLTSITSGVTPADANMDRELWLCSLTPSTYTVQWSNRNEWEAYPTDHGKAIVSGTVKSAWDEAHFYRECSNKGNCNRQSGQCECYAGYEGEGCSRTTCPNDCSGHGTCRRPIDIDDAYQAWDAYKTQSCKCDAGYTGPDCSLRVCPSGDDPITRINDRNEIQTITLKEVGFVFTYPNDDPTGFATLATTNAGIRFALDFEDEFGDRWVTRSISAGYRRAATTAGANAYAAQLASDIESALEALPNNCIEDVEVSVDLSTNSAADEVYAITFLNNSGDIPMLGARYRFGKSADNAVANAVESKNTPDGYFGVAAGGFTIAETVKGNKENVVCSNRGLCDYATGICKCFNGYTDFDCSVQNALSMG